MKGSGLSLGRYPDTLRSPSPSPESRRLPPGAYRDPGSAPRGLPGRKKREAPLPGSRKSLPGEWETCRSGHSAPGFGGALPHVKVPATDADSDAGSSLERPGLRRPRHADVTLSEAESTDLLSGPLSPASTPPSSLVSRPASRSLSGQLHVPADMPAGIPREVTRGTGGNGPPPVSSRPGELTLTAEQADWVPRWALAGMVLSAKSAIPAWMNTRHGSSGETSPERDDGQWSDGSSGCPDLSDPGEVSMAPREVAGPWKGHSPEKEGGDHAEAALLARAWEFWVHLEPEDPGPESSAEALPSPPRRGGSTASAGAAGLLDAQVRRQEESVLASARGPSPASYPRPRREDVCDPVQETPPAPPAGSPGPAEVPGHRCQVDRAYAAVERGLTHDMRSYASFRSKYRELKEAMGRSGSVQVDRLAQLLGREEEAIRRGPTRQGSLNLNLDANQGWDAAKQIAIDNQLKWIKGERASLHCLAPANDAPAAPVVAGSAHGSSDGDSRWNRWSRWLRAAASFWRA